MKLFIILENLRVLPIFCNFNHTVKELNTTCPSCRSKNVNNRIKQIKGNIDGEMSGSGNLFFYSSYGSIHGSVNTLPINKCNDCHHEWEKSKNEVSSYEIKESILLHAYYALVDHKDNKEKYWDDEVTTIFSGISTFTFCKLFKEEYKYDDYYLKKFNEVYDFKYLITLGLVDINEKIINV